MSKLKIFQFLYLLHFGLAFEKEGPLSKIRNFDLPISNTVPFALGGATVVFKDVALGDDISTLYLKCYIYSLNDGESTPVEVDAVVTNNFEEVVCRLPPQITSGRVRVDLEVHEIDSQDLLQTHTSMFLVTPTPMLEIEVEEDWDTKEVEFTWDPAYFRKFYTSGSPIFLMATLYKSYDGTANFIPTNVRMAVGFSDIGTARVQVIDANFNQIVAFNYPYFYLLQPAGTQEIFQTSGLFTPTAGKTEGNARDICANWVANAEGPPPQNETYPCPNCYCKVTLDHDFVETEYPPQILKMTRGKLNNHKLFYQRVPTPSGHAQSCSYNIETSALATSSPSEAAWINYVSKDISYVDNYFADVWPYIVCCLQTNSAEFCDSFHQRRPIDTGHTYPGADEPCQGTGDPHMITFDGVRYDFMGYGEFWLIKGDDASFGVQGRMSPLTEAAQVTYFRAVALRDGNTTVQIQHKDNQLQIILNRETLLDVPGINGRTVPLGEASLTVNGNQIEVRLQTGFTIKLGSNPGAHVFDVYGFGARHNKGKGFAGIFGEFDGNIENDLTNREGLVIPPTAENIRNLSLLHNSFGLTWRTTEEESFFTYEDGLSWANYQKLDFGPILEYPNPADMPEEVRAICKENLACYYEYVGTGELKDAEDTARADELLEELKEEINEEVLMCGQIPNPENGKVTVEGYLSGSLARYSCNAEYELSGVGARTCLEGEGEEGRTVDWDGEEPVCNWTCGLCTEQVDYQLSHDPSDCNKYFLCTFGVRYYLVCPEGENFNRETLVCDRHYECQGQPGC